MVAPHIHIFQDVAQSWVWAYQECVCGKRRAKRIDDEHDQKCNWRWVNHHTGEVFPEWIDFAMVTRPPGSKRWDVINDLSINH